MPELLNGGFIGGQGDKKTARMEGLENRHEKKMTEINERGIFFPLPPLLFIHLLYKHPAAGWDVNSVDPPAVDRCLSACLFL